MNIDKALVLAVTAHTGQLDKTGIPYILHPIRVMVTVGSPAFGGDEDEMVAAILHDVVEDTYLTLDHLMSAGLNERQRTIVEALTRRTGENYESYIDRVRVNTSAVSVKVADLLDNLSESRMRNISDKKTRDRLSSKYSDALKVLSPIMLDRVKNNREMVMGDIPS